jgi:dihydrofolate reductase
MSTGAVVAGRRTFEPAGGWGGDHHDGVPIWVFSRHEPGIDVSNWPLVTYANDLTSAMSQAKEAARTRILEGEGGVTHMHYAVRR